MTIRVRLLALLVLLGAIVIGQALLIVYLQRLSDDTREGVDRRAAVRDLQSQVELSLLEMRSAARAAIRTGAANGALDAAALDYTTTMAALEAATRDPQQRTLLDVIARDVDRWRVSWPRPVPDAPHDEVERAIASLDSVYAPVSAGLNAFRIRQDLLYADAQDAARRTASRYTTLVIASSAVALLIIGIATAAVRRVLLAPLAALAADAERITRGEYPRVSRSNRRDEIGALINAFTGMIETLHNREAELSGALAMSRDLAGRYKASEEAAHRSRAELETVIETVPAALVLVHKSEGVRRQNRAATRLIGSPPEGESLAGDLARFSLAGRDGLELPPPRWPLIRALGGETVPGEDLIVRTPDGRELPMLISAAPMVADDGQTWGAVAVFQDLSALKAIDRLKDEFVSIVSHELRTPLTSIRGSLQLVLDDQDSVPDPDHRQLVQIALNNCERLIRIINDILDIAKIEAGKTALVTQPVVVRDLVRTAIENVEGVARAATVSFAVNIPADLPPVDADADRIVQVIVNLLSNAVKFAPPQSRVSVDAVLAGRMIEVAISDRGRGIDAADLPRLFQKFQQLDGSPTRAKGGTGLGLAIVRGLVEQHGGTVTVDSRPGEGTRFAFTLPVAKTVPASDGAEPRVRTAAARVLVVDDDDDFRGVTRRQLERAGFVVLEAREGAEALRTAREQRPDVITLDLLMPGMNGWTLLRSLADDPDLSDIPAVVLSSVADRSGNLARDIAVLAKASGIEALLAEITALLPSSSGTILVAEDDDDLRLLLAKALQRRGFATREARDGVEALARIDDSVSLVVLDLNMPDVDGLEVLRQLRERPAERRMPVLVITGTEGAEAHAMALGASGYLTKPLEVAEVARIVQRLVSRR